MPRWYKGRSIERAAYYQGLKDDGYSSKVARRMRDWNSTRRHQRFNPRIKDKPGEGTLFWKERLAQTTQ